MRKSEAKDLLCPKCNQTTLIKAGKTTPDKLSGKWYQRYRCLNPQCPLTITIRPLEATKRTLEVDASEQIIVVRRDKSGKFLKRPVR